MEKENFVTSEFTEKDFEFVATNNTGKIQDEKFKTKPTTFLKDCFKRFCKNKSSVVGAIIIGVLLLGSFIAPLCNPRVNEVHTESSKLLPKLFESGTGFWDGTVNYEHIAWDYENDVPGGLYRSVNFKKTAISNLKENEITYTNQVTNYGMYGYLRITEDNELPQTADPYANLFFLQHKKTFDFDTDKNVKASVIVGTEDGIEGFKLGQVQFVLNCSNLTDPIILKDFTSYASETKEDVTVDLDLSAAVANAGLGGVLDAQLCIRGLPTKGYKSYLLVKSVSMTSTSPSLQEKLNDFSFDNATKCARITIDPGTKQYPNNFWQSNGQKFVAHSMLRYVDFTYDPYEHVFGLQENFEIPKTNMATYIANGWCKYTYGVPSSFQKLDEQCPVETVTKEELGKIYGNILNYKYLGYTSMPKYILGSDGNGRDLLTYSMNCLKTSLLVAIITSAVCLAIGLVWGSISGYFGGTVDLLMERFTDILSGVPWIVMMTLIIILLGNNVVTFAIAVIMTGWIGTASLTRTQFYRFRDREYVLASRTLGSSDARLIFKHILPNALGTLVTSSVLMIPGCIFSEASISYLGLGLKGVASFGVLLSDNQKYLATYPMLIIFPAIIISLLMISFNLFGNGLRDALNPTLKGGEQ